MKHVLATIIALVLAGSTLWAQGNLTVPYTAEQLDGVKWAMAASDPDDDNEDEGDVTNAEAAAFGTAACQSIWDSYVRQRALARELAQDIRTKYQNLSDANKTAVEAYIDACIASGTCA